MERAEAVASALTLFLDVNLIMQPVCSGLRLVR